MMIDTENKLLSIDESCLSELSEENESTISGGLFGVLFWKWPLIFSWKKPVYTPPVHPAPQPPKHYPHH